MAIRKILVVDDARADLMNIEKIVLGAGYQVITATSGEEAIDKAKADKPDMIFIYLMINFSGKNSKMEMESKKMG